MRLLRQTSVLKQPLFFRGINLPIYFKYVCGNVVDVSTLTRTMKELKAYNIDTKFAVLDAGYLYCWASKPPATVDEIELLAKSRNIKTSYSSFLTLSNTTKVLLVTIGTEESANIVYGDSFAMRRKGETISASSYCRDRAYVDSLTGLIASALLSVNIWAYM